MFKAITPEAIQEVAMKILVGYDGPVNIKSVWVAHRHLGLSLLRRGVTHRVCRRGSNE
jgi:hypothetical protein